MDSSQREFYKRTERLKRRHRAMGNGYAATLRSDGLIVVEPRKFQFKLPLRGFVLLMGAFMLFKGFMLSHLGDDTYLARLDILNTGSNFGQAGAFVMGIDPITRVVADGFNAVTSTTK